MRLLLFFLEKWLWDSHYQNSSENPNNDQSDDRGCPCISVSEGIRHRRIKALKALMGRLSLNVAWGNDHERGQTVSFNP